MSGLPLEGVRVLDLSRLLPGGFCSLLLADFGADVVKVEDTGMGDYIRWSPPHHAGVEQSAGSGLFLSLNVARSLGGTLRAANRDPHGAEVTLDLPLASLTLEEPDDDRAHP